MAGLYGIPTMPLRMVSESPIGIGAAVVAYFDPWRIDEQYEHMCKAAKEAK